MKDQVFTGRIDLEPNTSAAEYPGKKKENLFRITTSKRIFFLYGEKPDETKAWIEAINQNVKKMKDGSLPSTTTTTPTGGFGSASGGFRSDPPANTTPQTQPTTTTNPKEETNHYNDTPNYNPQPTVVTTTPTPTQQPKIIQQEADPTGEISPRARLSLAKGVVGFLKDESKHQVTQKK